MTDWSDDAYDAAESHGQHVEGSLDWYSDWAGPLGADVFAAADRLGRTVVSLSSRLLVAPEGLAAGSSPARGLPLCVVCDDAGCPHLPWGDGVKARDSLFPFVHRRHG